MLHLHCALLALVRCGPAAAAAAEAWHAVLQVAIKNCRGLMPDGKSKPSVLALSRQGMPNLPGSCKTEAQKGGYVVHGGDGKPDIILMSSGKWPGLACSCSLGHCMQPADHASSSVHISR